MKFTTQLFIVGFVLGSTIGVGGYHVYQTEFRDRDREPIETVKGAKTPDDGLVAAQAGEYGLALRIRPTDQLARLNKDEQTAVGVRVFDPLVGDVTSAPHVDVIAVRQTEFYDQPDATSIAEFKNPTIDGLKIDQTKELTINGHDAIKQLYSADVEVPGPFGSKQKRPIPGLRYVIDRGNGEFLVLRSGFNEQKLLDLVAQNIRFVPVTSASSGGSVESRNINVNDLVGDTAPLQNASNDGSGATAIPAGNGSSVPLKLD